MKIDYDSLKRIDNDTDKFYYPIYTSDRSRFPLNFIFILEPHDIGEIIFTEIKGAEKVIRIRNEIYRWEYLLGMKENEIIYFGQINELCRSVRIICIKRPDTGRIENLRLAVLNYLKDDVIS